MTEKLKFQHEFAISRLTKIVKTTKKRIEPRNACDLFDFITELSGDIRQLKDVIEEVKAINKKLLAEQKITASSQPAAKAAKSKKPKKAETKKLMKVEEAKKLLFKKQQNLKSIKKRRDTLITESFSVKGPKLNDEMLNEIMQKLIRKNGNKGIDLVRFMLAGRDTFKVALKYFSKFKFSKAEVSYSSYFGNNKLSLSNREQNIPNTAESNSASIKSKESDSDKSSESDDSDNTDINVMGRPTTDDEEEEDENDDDGQRWEFSADSDEWHKKQKGFHPYSIKNNILEFEGFLLMKPLSLVFVPFIKEITIDSEPGKQMYPFLNTFTELDELRIEGYVLKEKEEDDDDEDKNKDNSQIFVNCLKELKKVETFKISARERKINLTILKNINFNIDKFIIQEFGYASVFPSNIFESVKTLSLTVFMEEKECKKFAAKNVSKYLICFPNALNKVLNYKHFIL